MRYTILCRMKLLPGFQWGTCPRKITRVQRGTYTLILPLGSSNASLSLRASSSPCLCVQTALNMSRIYDNKPLQSVPVENQAWSGEWNPQQFQSGSGALLEGKIESRSKHVITDSKQQKGRYYVLHVRVRIAHRRQYNSKGDEIEPNMDATQKVTTGHLMSSYKVEAKGQTDRFTHSKLSTLVNKPSLTALTQRHTPEGCLAFWMTEQELEDLELVDGDIIKLTTKGDGPFIDSVGKLDTSTMEMTTMAGSGQVGASWTDKIMAVKSHDPPNPKPGQEENEGAGDDEWDD